MKSEEPNPELIIDQPESATISNCYLGLSHARSTAIAAGDLRAGVLQEVTNILAANRSNPLLATKVGLERLQGIKLITSTEQRALGEICNTLFALQRSKISKDEAFGKTRAIYKELIADEKSSPIALAIASMSAGDANATAPNNLDLTSDEQTVLAASSSGFGGDIGMVGGAIAGAIIGLRIGGAGGAIIGAVVGGIAGGVAGACAD